MLKHFVIFTFEDNFLRKNILTNMLMLFPELKKSIQKSKKFQFTKIVLIVLLIWI